MQGVKYNLIDPFCCCAYLSCICKFTHKKMERNVHQTNKWKWKN